MSREGIITGHPTLVTRFYHSGDKCTGVPYDTQEIDVTEGQTCLTDASSLGFYWQRVPDNATHVQKCISDNDQCMSNENLECFVFPHALGTCVEDYPYSADASQGTINLMRTIEDFKPLTGWVEGGNKIAVEETYATDDCTGGASTTLEIYGAGERACTGFASGKSYRAFHNHYDDDHIRVCDYSANLQMPDQSCNDNAFLCHVYGHNKCALHPEGGSFRVWTRPQPGTPAKQPDAASRTTTLSIGVAVVLVIMSVGFF